MMSSYEIAQLLSMWEFDKISPDQAIGQLLVHQQALQRRVDALERQIQRTAQEPETADKTTAPLV